MSREVQQEPLNLFEAGPEELPQSRALSHFKAKLAVSSKDDATTHAIRKLLKKAVAAFKENDYRTCCAFALQALDKDGENPQANHIMAVGLEKLGELHKAIQFFERAIQRDPEDYEIYFNLGLVAWRLKMLPQAERLFRLYSQKVPNKAEGFNNLSGVLRDQNKYEAAIEILRTAIYQFPEDPQLWSSLGTVLMEAGDLTQARIFIDEAIRLRPNYARGYHNLGYLLNHSGPMEDALTAYDHALSLQLSPSDRVETEHARAICLFHLGRRKDAFEQWYVRTEPRYKAAPLYNFRLREWKGEPLAGKQILLIAEQGLGDEIMFANAIPEIIEEVGETGRVLIACTKRLVPLFTRSFPKATVGVYHDTKHNDRVTRSVPWLAKAGQVDYFSPFASTLLYKRETVELFNGRSRLLTADPERVEHWRSRLRSIGSGPFVGICWKNLVSTGKRAKFYSPIQLWGPVFRTPGVTFVNLQYGDCAADIAEAEKRFGIKIYNFEDIDLKNNLDDNSALCSALDLVITAPNAASALAGGVGTEVWFITLCEVWPQLGTDRMPWYPKTRVFVPKAFGDFEDSLRRAGTALGERAAAAQAHAA